MVGCLAGVGARLTARHIQQQQVAQLESKCQQLDKVKDDLQADLKAKDKQMEESARAANERYQNCK